MSMPRLWCSLAIKVHRHGCWPRVDGISEWLRRAEHRPLSLSLTLDGRPGVDAHTNTGAALHAIIAFFSTWKRVIISVGPFLNLPSLLGISRTPEGSRLENLDIYLPNTFGQAREYLNHIFTCSPALRRLALRSDVVDGHLEPVKVPFAGLTHLHLHYVMFTMNNCLEILTQAPGLTVFEFNDGLVDFEHVRRSPPVVLSHLRVLTLCSSATMMNVFFDNLTLPSLETLRAEFVYPFPMQSFLNLVSRSSCSPTQLIFDAPISEEDLTSCVRAVTASLRTLRLGPCCIDCVGENLLALMTVQDKAPDVCLCPGLQVIDFGELGPSVPDGTFSSMIESRCKGHVGITLPQLVNFVPYGDHTLDLVRLQALHHLYVGEPLMHALTFLPQQIDFSPAIPTELMTDLVIYRFMISPM